MKGEGGRGGTEEIAKMLLRLCKSQTAMTTAGRDREGPDGVKKDLPSVRALLVTDICRNGRDTSGTDH